MVKIELFSEPETSFKSFKVQYRKYTAYLTEDPLLVIIVIYLKIN